MVEALPKYLIFLLEYSAWMHGRQAISVVRPPFRSEGMWSVDEGRSQIGVHGASW